MAIPAMLTSYRRELRQLTEDRLNLRNFEWRGFSQNCEDGIIAEIFCRIGTKSRYCVEFGIESGIETCTRWLIEREGWSGLWIEGSPRDAAAARQRALKFGVAVKQEFITAENIQQIFRTVGVPVDLDLLVIDIDGNDYWVWQALRDYAPRVVVIEYNGSFKPPADWVMPYRPDHTWNLSDHYGASLVALTRLAHEKGYSLVGCDSCGVNAFFVRRDELAGKFSHVGDVSRHYIRPKALFFSHWRRLFGHVVRGPAVGE